MPSIRLYAFTRKTIKPREIKNPNTGVISPSDYQTDLTVEQLDRDDTVLKSYIFRNAFPTNISAIELSSAEATEIETFDIEWRYQHFEPSGVSF